jgi:uncharacterized protein YbjT (DUF2867 family)
MTQRILVVGASGYVGGRLVPLLATRGHELVLMSRDARSLAARFPDATVVAVRLDESSTVALLIAALARLAARRRIDEASQRGRSTSSDVTF